MTKHDTSKSGLTEKFAQNTYKMMIGQAEGMLRSLEKEKVTSQRYIEELDKNIAKVKKTIEEVKKKLEE